MTDIVIADESKELLGKFTDVDGMMTITAAAAFISVFGELRRRGIKGHWLETGVYLGKSAALLCGSARANEDVVLIDVGYHDTWGHLGELHDSIVSIVSESEKVEQTFPSITKYFGKTMVMHSDGSHFYDNVYSDITLAHKLLTEDGLLILDDFGNPHYPQVQAAAYTYLAALPEHFSFFMTGENKAFLCRPSRHKDFINYVLSDFPAAMDAIGHPVLISKTDYNPNFDVLSFRHRQPNDEGTYYGMNLYAHLYQPR
jgi:hypothetical protein